MKTGLLLAALLGLSLAGPGGHAGAGLGKAYAETAPAFLPAAASSAGTVTPAPAVSGGEELPSCHVIADDGSPIRVSEQQQPGTSSGGVSGTGAGSTGTGTPNADSIAVDGPVSRFAASITGAGAKAAVLLAGAAGVLGLALLVRLLRRRRLI